jgi:hypothetical protein
MDPIREIKDRLADHPELRFTATDDSITVQAPTPDGFAVSFIRLSNAFLVHFDGWHEHFESAGPALECFAFGFSGKARVAVTYRGRIPVKWVLEYLEDDRWHIDSEVGHFLVPFWLRPKIVYRQNPNLLRDG